VCMSRVRRVLACDPDGTAVVEGAGGGRERVSLLALDGPPPPPPEWGVVPTGDAGGRRVGDTARAVLADLAVVRGAAPEGDA